MRFLLAGRLRPHHIKRLNILCLFIMVSPLNNDLLMIFLVGIQKHLLVAAQLYRLNGLLLVSNYGRWLNLLLLSSEGHCGAEWVNDWLPLFVFVGRLLFGLVRLDFRKGLILIVWGDVVRGLISFTASAATILVLILLFISLRQLLFSLPVETTWTRIAIVVNRRV